MLYDEIVARTQLAIECGEKCLRCGRVPCESYEDCIDGKEIEGGGLEPHVFTYPRDIICESR